MHSSNSLEEDWKHIVVDWTLLTEKQRQQQNAIWELVQTEVAYIRTLKVITDVSRSLLSPRTLPFFDPFWGPFLPFPLFSHLDLILAARYQANVSTREGAPVLIGR